MILFLLREEEIQERIFREISQATNGNEREVGLGDRPRLHLTNAFLDEVFRWGA